MSARMILIFQDVSKPTESLAGIWSRRGGPGVSCPLHFQNEGSRIRFPKSGRLAGIRYHCRSPRVPALLCILYPFAPNGKTQKTATFSTYVLARPGPGRVRAGWVALYGAPFYTDGITRSPLVYRGGSVPVHILPDQARAQSST